MQVASPRAHAYHAGYRPIFPIFAHHERRLRPPAPKHDCADMARRVRLRDKLQKLPLAVQDARAALRDDDADAGVIFQLLMLMIRFSR